MNNIIQLNKNQPLDLTFTSIINSLDHDISEKSVYPFEESLKNHNKIVNNL